MALGSMLLGGALVADGAVLYKRTSRRDSIPRRTYVDGRVYVSSPRTDPAQYNKLRSEIDAVQKSLEVSSEVLANMLFAQVEQDPRKSLETLVKGAGFAEVQPLLLDASGVEVFGTQKSSAGPPELITFKKDDKRFYGIGTKVQYHGEFFVPKGQLEDKEMHVMDYDGWILLKPLNILVSDSSLALPKPTRKRIDQHGLMHTINDSNLLSNSPITMNNEPYTNSNGKYAKYMAEGFRQMAKRRAMSQFLAFQRDVKNDERILAQLFENAWNAQFHIVPITEREPQHKGSEATAYLRDRLQQRLTPSPSQ